MKHNKALIITLPIGKNYGGIIQAFALSKVVASLGLDATVGVPYSGNKGWVMGTVKDSIYKILGKKREGRPSIRVGDYISSDTQKFIDKNIDTVRLYDFSLSKNRKISEKYKYFVSGSDQVWRGWRALPFYMSDFAIRDDSVRISYAASFGVSDPMFTKYGANRARLAATTLSGVSVREVDGIKVCRKYWNIDAVQHVDPTLLLDVDDYLAVADDSGSPVEGNLFAYVLDRGGFKGEIIDRVASVKKLSPFEILPKAYTNKKDFKASPEDYRLPHVEQWLRSFRDAKFVVTDSFHGTVFSIIFNKPFISIGNKDRGLARFTSLLEMFGLENRLVSSADDITDELLNEQIDWDRVNANVKSEQERSFAYLKKHLGSSDDE